MLGLVLLGVLAVLAAAVSPAAAAKSCGRQVLDDWSDGQVEGTYADRCYSDALAIAPRDLLLYSSLEDDLRRALQAANRGKPAPPNSEGYGTPEAPAEQAPVAGTPAEEPAPDSRTPAGSPPAAPAVADEPEGPEAAPAVASESATSLPLPLLVLAGLGLLLVGGGSAGYLLRRLRGRPTPP